MTDQQKIEAAKKGLRDIAELMGSSDGIYGLHRNGDPSPWSELREGGEFEKWLHDFEVACSALGVEI